MVTDLYHDTAYVTLRDLNHTYTVPSFAKDASLSSQDELDSLPDEAFAYPEKRMYPVHTASDAYWSNAYFFHEKEAREKLPRRVYENLVKAAYLYRIEKNVVDLVKQATVTIPRQDSEYGLVTKYGKETLRKYYMPDREHVKKAEQYFSTNYQKYPIEWRKQIASSIIKKASQHGHPITSSVVEAYAGTSVTDSREAALNIAMRAAFMKKASDEAKLYVKLGQACIGRLREPAYLHKLASVVEKLDKLTGMDKYYDVHYPDPYRSVYNLSVKQAEEAVKVINIAGDQYTTDELVGVGADTYRDALGDDFAKQVTDATGNVDKSKVTSVIATLPLPEKKMVSKHVQQAITSRTPTEEGGVNV